MKTKQILAIIVIFVMGLQLSLNAQDSKTKTEQSLHQNQLQGELKNHLPNPPPPPSVLPGIPNLSKEQSESIHKLQITLAIAKLPLENNVREKEARLHTLSTLKNPDIKEIEKQIDEIGVVKIQLAKMQAAHDLDIRNILDDEQRLIFDKRPPMPEFF
jgi:hypothetical protein